MSFDRVLALRDFRVFRRTGTGSMMMRACISRICARKAIMVQPSKDRSLPQRKRCSQQLKRHSTEYHVHSESCFHWCAWHDWTIFVSSVTITCEETLLWELRKAMSSTAKMKFDVNITTDRLSTCQPNVDVLPHGLDQTRWVVCISLGSRLGSTVAVVCRFSYIMTHVSSCEGAWTRELLFFPLSESQNLTLTRHCRLQLQCRQFVCTGCAIDMGMSQERLGMITCVRSAISETRRMRLEIRDVWSEVFLSRWTITSWCSDYSKVTLRHSSYPYNSWLKVE